MREQFTQVALLHGRIGFYLRHAGDGETVEIDFPQGGVWLLGPGTYDIDAGDGDRPPRVAVFEGTAHLVGAGGETPIEAGQAAVLAGAEAAATIEPAAPDDFAEWCREPRLRR